MQRIENSLPDRLPAALTSFDRPIHALVQGASGGLGLAFVRQLLEMTSTPGASGADSPTSKSVIKVVATCRRPSKAQDLRALEIEHPGRLEVLPLDVTKEESIVSVAGALQGRDEGLDLILNCSGWLHRGDLQPEKRLSHLDPKALEESFRVNAYGPLLVLKHLAPLLPRRERSVVASLSARVGSIGDNRLGGWYSYRASKAALNQLHHTLAIELARSHPGCVCVVLHPGTVDTGLSRPFQARVPTDKLFLADFAAAQLLQVIDQLEPGQSGGFFAWDGSSIPW